MGVLYDVLFKPIGRVDGSIAIAKTATAPTDGPVTTTSAAATAVDHPAPEWVLGRRDSGSLVWRRYGVAPTRRKRVEFLDAVQVHEFERDDYGDTDRDNPLFDGRDDDDDDDDQPCWADDWTSWDEDSGGGGGGGGVSKTLFCGPTGKDDYPVVVAASVTMLGLSIGVAYMFAPVRWLFHQLLVD